MTTLRNLGWYLVLGAVWLMYVSFCGWHRVRQFLGAM